MENSSSGQTDRQTAKCFVYWHRQLLKLCSVDTDKRTDCASSLSLYFLHFLDEVLSSPPELRIISLRPNLITFMSFECRYVGNMGCCPTAGKGSKLTSKKKKNIYIYIVGAWFLYTKANQGRALNWIALCIVTSNKNDNFILPGLTIK